MELDPGSYGFGDLASGDGFATGWVVAGADRLAAWRALAGMDPAGAVVPPLFVLALVEGAKAAGPVQIRADAVASWDLAVHAPLAIGARLRGRYRVAGLRAAGRGRGIIALGLRIEDARGGLVMAGRTRLAAPRG